MSSMQVDTRERGFSYAYDAPLDMRMDPTQELSAREVVNEWDERDLSRALRDCGEERYARQIARAIVRARARGADRHDDGARRRRHRRGPRAGAVRGRASGQAHLPGDPDRRQRRARTARLGAAARVALLAHRTAGLQGFPSTPGRPAREALPGRPRARVHCPPDLPVCVCGGEPEAELLTRRAIVAGVGRDRREPARRLRAACAPPASSKEAPNEPTARPPPPVARRTQAARPRARCVPSPARGASPARRQDRGPAAPPTTSRRRSVVGAAGARPHARRLAALLDRLIRGRTWVAVIAVALIGIVSCRSHARAERRHRPRGREGHDARAAEHGAARGGLAPRLRRPDRHGGRSSSGWSCRTPARSATRTSTADATRAAQDHEARRPGSRRPAKAAVEAGVGTGALALAPSRPRRRRAPRRRPPPSIRRRRRSPGAAHTPPRRRRQQPQQPAAPSRPGATQQPATQQQAPVQARAQQQQPVQPQTPAAQPQQPTARRRRGRRRRRDAGRLGPVGPDRSAASACSSRSSSSCSASPSCAPAGSASSSASTLKNAAATQQVVDGRAARPARHDHRPQRHRARGLRARRATSPRRRTSSRTREARPRSSPRSSASRGRPARQAHRRDSGFVYLARKVPVGRAPRRSASSTSPASTSRPTSRRDYPRDWLASQLLGTVKTDGQRPARAWSTARTRTLHGKRRRAPDRAATRSASRSRSARHERPTEPGARHPADARRRDPGQGRGGPRAASAQAYRPKGATAIVMDPRTGEVLAVANWPRVDANDVARRAARTPGRTAPSASPTSPARRSRRSPSPARCRRARHARHDVRPAADRSRSPTGTIGESHARGAVTLTTAEILAQSSNVGAITIGLRLRRQSASTSWVRRFGFGKPTGVDLPGEEQGIVLPLEEVLGLLDGQPADRPGRGGDADADGHRLLGDRQRRHPAPAAHRRADRRQARSPMPQGQPRHLRRTAAASVRKMLEGVFAAGGTASEVSIPGYKLAGKTGTANKVDPATGEYSERRLRRVVRRLRAGATTRSCSSRSWSTSRRARSTAARSPRPRSAEIARSPCRTCGIPPRVRPWPAPAARRLAPMTLRERVGDAAPRRRRRGHRARLRQPRVGPGHAVLLRAAASRATGTTSPPRRWRAGAVGARRRASARARRARRSWSPTCAPRWRPPPRASTATRPRAARSSASPGRTARRPRRSSSASCWRPPARRPGCSAR